MSPAIQQLLVSIGICRNFPCALVFAPTKYFGLGIKHLYTSQETERILNMIQHTANNTETGNLYRASLEHLIIEVGMGELVFDQPYHELCFLATPSLVKSTWQFLYTNSIHLKHDVNIPILREQDRPIMQDFYASGYRDLQLAAINRCRLFLNVYSMSDIVTSDGLSIKAHI